MNPRLLSAAQKAKNAKERGFRKTRRQWYRRREAFLGRIALGIGDAVGVLELVTPRESTIILAGHLNAARHIAARIHRFGTVADVVEKAQQAGRQVLAVDRPARVLKVDYRSRFYPWLVSPMRPAERSLSMAAALATARRLAGQRESPHRLLDYLECATNLPWHSAAHMLYRERLIPSPFSDVQVEGIRRARVFWMRYDDACGIYATMLHNGEVMDAGGNWAFVDAPSLAALFPRIKVPRALRRAAYLVNIVGSGVDLCADFHSFPSRLPLFRHPS